MNNYEKIFHSTCGGVFLADVYSVLVAFGVTCPARSHAIKKLLMPGQRGAKSEVQDLDEALVSVSRAIDMAHARLPDGGTPTGEPMAEPEAEPEPEPKPEPKPKPKTEPKIVTWRRCVRMDPGELKCQWFWVGWHPSGNIPQHWYPIEAQSRPIQTVKQLPEGCEP